MPKGLNGAVRGGLLRDDPYLHHSSLGDSVKRPVTARVAQRGTLRVADGRRVKLQDFQRHGDLLRSGSLSPTQGCKMESSEP